MIFFALMITSCLYALARGGRPEQIGAATLLGGAFASALVIHPIYMRFQGVEAGMLIVDIAMVSSFLYLAIKSTRFWPVWIAAALGAEVAVHATRAFVPDVVPSAYMDAVALWSWGAQLMLIAATARHRRRLRHLGSDNAWRN